LLNSDELPRLGVLGRLSAAAGAQNGLDSLFRQRPRGETAHGAFHQDGLGDVYGSSSVEAVRWTASGVPRIWGGSLSRWVLKTSRPVSRAA
jgi:hypothetical protein